MASLPKTSAANPIPTRPAALAIPMKDNITMAPPVETP
eukprot:CAMPEP_0184992652 /NCGR_PEP_ID=MMETSP1098-20130426/42059_1 /TAXON_ID=89044 /ORGANISM="Spumella elongata, Strain CCAP 955/1" /LENGTH=37 /DNA_ID= /DNA_START= /DNA_END= /DNA_ORIENTATION=